MKIKNFQLHELSPTNSSKVMSVTVPEGSIFRKADILNSTVFVWYEVPTIETNLTRVDRFHSPLQNHGIEPDTTFIDILLTTVMDKKGTELILIFPLYKYNEQ